MNSFPRLPKGVTRATGADVFDVALHARHIPAPET